MDQLCGPCSSLELGVSSFLDTLNQPQGWQTAKRLLRRDTLAAFKSSKGCRLCQLISYGVEDTRQEWQRRRLDDAEVQCYVHLGLYRWETSKPFPALDVATQFPFHGPSYGIQLLPAGPLESQHSLIGRVGDTSTIPVKHLRSWLQTCVELHEVSCGSSGFSRYQEIKDSMLFIDVDEQCIVRSTACPTYVALSYVWGKNKFIELRKENFESLQQPQSITKILDKIPQTIQDTMILTRELGHKHLWVDSLCIIQDDSSFKSKIISKMNLVYSNALLTILAASGSDANAGLQGVGKTPRSFEERIARIGDDLSLVYPLSHQKLTESIWSTRGWT